MHIILFEDDKVVDLYPIKECLWGEHSVLAGQELLVDAILAGQRTACPCHKSCNTLPVDLHPQTGHGQEGVQGLSHCLLRSPAYWAGRSPPNP